MRESPVRVPWRLSFSVSYFRRTAAVFTWLSNTFETVSMLCLFWSPVRSVCGYRSPKLKGLFAESADSAARVTRGRSLSRCNESRAPWLRITLFASPSLTGSPPGFPFSGFCPQLLPVSPPDTWLMFISPSRRAIEELLRETDRARVRAETMGPTGWWAPSALTTSTYVVVMDIPFLFEESALISSTWFVIFDWLCNLWIKCHQRGWNIASSRITISYSWIYVLLIFMACYWIMVQNYMV